MIGDKNVLVNPAKKGKVGRNVYLGGNIENMHEPYDKIKELATESRLYH